MKNIVGIVLMACCLVAGLAVLTACNDKLDIQQSYDFTVETMPVPSQIVPGGTAEIRCELQREGHFENDSYTIRYFQSSGKGSLRLDDGTVFLPNNRYPLPKEIFRLYYTSASTDQQTIDIVVESRLGKRYDMTFNFNNDSSSGEGTE